MLSKSRNQSRSPRWLLLYSVFVTVCVVLLYLGTILCFTSSCNIELKSNRENNVKSKVNDEWWFFKMFAKTSPPKAKMSAFLVVLVLSSPRNMERRVTIRQTWLKDLKGNVLHLFAIGSTFLEVEEKRTLESEINHFSDILYLPNVNESYATLSNKLLQSLKWIEANVNFDFLLKCDDDSYVRVDEIVVELESFSKRERFYWGFFDGRARPVKRDGKWAEKQWVLCDHYLPYALGGGYILSYDLVRFIAVNSGYLKLYGSEDVSVGSWLAPVDLKRVHDSRFDTEFLSRGCSDSYLITHKQSVDQIKEKYWLLQEKDVLCSSEHRTRLSYEYNWNVQPSHCYFRNDSSIP